MVAHTRNSLRLLIALCLVLQWGAAVADPPGRVGRLADLQGQVWMYDTETAEWLAAVRNRPLTSGDRVSTDGNARAELRIGSSTLRLDAGSEVELVQIDDDMVRVQLHNGSLALRLRTHESAREFELVTAEGRFKPDRAGRYRFDRLDATSSATVWSGQLLFEAPDNAATIVAGQRADILNNGRTQYTLVTAQRDAFADEVAAAEQAEQRSVSAKYVSPEMTGAEELDRHGRWDNDADYGALWVPRAVVPGWAPYRFGHWAWVRPWGWTWVDDAAWGFAPFHYGRWVFLRNTWCWAPGRWVARPVYAPALVAWVGAPGVSIGIGVGPSVGWFPLAPREVYVPGYRVSPRYVRDVNVTHVANITNVTNIINSPNTVVQQTAYVNRGVPGAMTVVPASVVSGRQAVGPSRVQLTDPRPGERNMATMATLTAVAPVAAPPARQGAAVAPQPAVAAPPLAAGNGSLAAPRPQAAPNPLVATAPAAVAPPPMTQPVVRNPRPVTGLQPPADARAMPLPSPAGPPVVQPVRPAPPPPPGAKSTLPAPIPPSMVPQPVPAPAAPPPRAQPPSPTVTNAKPPPLQMSPQAVAAAPPGAGAHPAQPQPAAAKPAPVAAKPVPAPRATDAEPRENAKAERR